MRINSSTAYTPDINTDDIPVEDQIDVELMSKDLDAMRAEGAGVVRLIEAADVGVNMPLKEGPIGRRINIRI